MIKVPPKTIAARSGPVRVAKSPILAYISRKHDELQEKYSGQFVIVHPQKGIIGHGKTMEAAYN